MQVKLHSKQVTTEEYFLDKEERFRVNIIHNSDGNISSIQCRGPFITSVHLHEDNRAVWGQLGIVAELVARVRSQLVQLRGNLIEEAESLEEKAADKRDEAKYFAELLRTLPEVVG